VLFRITTGIERKQHSAPVVTVITQVNGHALGNTVVLEKPDQRRKQERKTWRTIGVEVPKSIPTITQIANYQKPDCAPINNTTNKLGISINTNARNLLSWVDEFCSGI
jgi:hypothetical protein